MLVAHWRTLLKRSHAIWAQLAQVVFGALSFFDPSVALAVWNQMPDSVASRVPERFVAQVGAVLFIWALVTILLRLFRQPKLEAKIEERSQEKRDEAA